MTKVGLSIFLNRRIYALFLEYSSQNAGINHGTNSLQRPDQTDTLQGTLF